jgi:hypothetical protein
MAGSPYATLVAILQADLTSARQAFFDHASRHACRDDECETKRELRAVRDSIRGRLAREMANSSPARPTVGVPAAAARGATYAVTCG